MSTRPAWVVHSAASTAPVRRRRSHKHLPPCRAHAAQWLAQLFGVEVLAARRLARRSWLHPGPLLHAYGFPLHVQALSAITSSAACFFTPLANLRRLWPLMVTVPSPAMRMNEGRFQVPWYSHDAAPEPGHLYSRARNPRPARADICKKDRLFMSRPSINFCAGAPACAAS